MEYFTTKLKKVGSKENPSFAIIVPKFLVKTNRIREDKWYKVHMRMMNDGKLSRINNSSGS
jgi:hypothetical protein